jgi:hypothetical protein
MKKQPLLSLLFLLLWSNQSNAQEKLGFTPAKYPQALSFTPLAAGLLRYGTVCYEQSVRKGKSVELRFTTLGRAYEALAQTISVSKGYAFTLGYKFITRFPKKADAHPLEGNYFRPEFTYYSGQSSYSVLKYDYATSAKTAAWQPINYTAYSAAFGKQMIFGNQRLNFLLNGFFSIGLANVKPLNGGNFIRSLSKGGLVNLDVSSDNAKRGAKAIFRMGLYVGMARR